MNPPTLESELANLTLLSIPFSYWVGIFFVLIHLLIFLIAIRALKSQITAR